MNGDFTSLDCRFFWFEFVSSYSNLFFPLIWILNCWTQFSLLFINMITYYNPEYYLNRTLMHRIHFALTLFLVKGTPVQRAAVCQFVFSYSTTFCTHTHTLLSFFLLLLSFWMKRRLLPRQQTHQTGKVSFYWNCICVAK